VKSHSEETERAKGEFLKSNKVGEYRSMEIILS